MADAGLNVEMMRTARAHASVVWFAPELRRRIDAGVWPEGKPVYAAQAVFYPARETVIRFNEEVRAVIGLDRRRAEIDGVDREVVVGVKWIELFDDESERGHMTFISNDVMEVGSIDARYNLPRAREHLSVAQEFLQTAEHAAAAGRLRPMAEALFGAVELVGKAYFLMTPEQRWTGKVHHDVLAAEFNLERHRGNVAADHARLLNRLRELRPAARYLNRPFDLSADEAAGLRVSARSLYERIHAETRPARDEPPPVLRRGQLAFT